MNKFKIVLSTNILLTSFIFASSTILPEANPINNNEVKKETKRKYTKLQNNKQGNSYFEYDSPNGWWWYKEETIQKDGKKIKTKTKFTKKEKIKFQAKKKTNELLEEQVELLKDVKTRLIYAFPYVAPIYSKDERTGKKCLTNSDEYCFVLPVQAEAQRVPVMANWLRKPSPTNSKKWLRWEAKYFNHLQKISLGNRFAYLSGGAEAYPTNTMYSMGDDVRSPVSERAKQQRKMDMITKVEKKLDVLLFLGKTSVLDTITNSHKEIIQWTRPEFKNYNVHFVFPTKERLEHFESNIREHSNLSVRKAWKKIKERKIIFIAPKYFDKFNIKISPSVVVIYKTDKKAKNEKGKETGKNEMIWQNVLTSSINPIQVKDAIFRFLEYNDIFKAKDLAQDIGLGSVQKSIKSPEPIVNEDKIYKDQQRIK